MSIGWITPYIALVMEWGTENPALAAPILAAIIAAITGVATAVIKGCFDVLVAWLNSRNGKDDPKPPQPKSSSR